MWEFTNRPSAESYRRLAKQLLLAEPPQMHPALWQRRAAVVERLFRMADDPERETNVSAYSALSLLVW